MLIAKRVINGCRGEDRISVLEMSSSTVFVVADGAGGIGSGSLAAEMTCRACTEGLKEESGRDSQAWETVLTKADQVVSRAAGGGEAAVVAVEVSGGRVVGASVGDCEAWLLLEDHVLRLTEAQNRKPLLGSGTARPIGFDAERPGRVLLASDGLFKYAPPARVAQIAREGSLEEAVIALCEEVQLPNGEYQDDVAVVLFQVNST